MRRRVWCGYAALRTESSTWHTESSTWQAFRKTRETRGPPAGESTSSVTPTAPAGPWGSGDDPGQGSGRVPMEVDVGVASGGGVSPLTSTQAPRVGSKLEVSANSSANLAEKKRNAEVEAEAKAARAEAKAKAEAAEAKAKAKAKAAAKASKKKPPPTDKEVKKAVKAVLRAAADAASLTRRQIKAAAAKSIGVADVDAYNEVVKGAIAKWLAENTVKVK